MEIADGSNDRHRHQQGQSGSGQGGDGTVPTTPPPEPDRSRSTAGKNGPVLQKSLQVVGQLTGRLVAVARIRGHRLEHDRLQIAGDGRVQLARPRWLAETLAHALWMESVKRRSEREHLVESQSQSVKVAGASDRPSNCSGAM